MSDADIPDSHPRAVSLRLRHRVTHGVEQGITSPVGLIAHGRGEAFDYLLGERTHSFATKAIEAAAAHLLLAQHPVISVNGNTAALVPDDIVLLAATVPAKLEVNIFHSGGQREKAIAAHLKVHGATEVLLPDPATTIDFIESNRRFVNPEGIFRADTIFVPLEDGDRAEALIKMRRKVLTIDLNPLSRTARMATVTIVDNVVRALPLLRAAVLHLSDQPRSTLEAVIAEYNHSEILTQAEECLRRML